MAIHHPPPLSHAVLKCFFMEYRTTIFHYLNFCCVSEWGGGGVVALFIRSHSIFILLLYFSIGAKVQFGKIVKIKFFYFFFYGLLDLGPIA